MKYVFIQLVILALALSCVRMAQRWEAGHGWNSIDSRPVAAWYR